MELVPNRFYVTLATRLRTVFVAEEHAYDEIVKATSSRL